jgi:hypothetical protein
MIAIKGLFSAHNEVRRPKPSTFGEDHKLYCHTENNYHKEKIGDSVSNGPAFCYVHMLWCLCGLRNSTYCHIMSNFGQSENVMI